MSAEPKLDAGRVDAREAYVPVCEQARFLRALDNRFAVSVYPERDARGMVHNETGADMNIDS